MLYILFFLQKCLGCLSVLALLEVQCDILERTWKDLFGRVLVTKMRPDNASVLSKYLKKYSSQTIWHLSQQKLLNFGESSCPKARCPVLAHKANAPEKCQKQQADSAGPCRRMRLNHIWLLDATKWPKFAKKKRAKVLKNKRSKKIEKSRAIVPHHLFLCMFSFIFSFSTANHGLGLLPLIHKVQCLKAMPLKERLLPWHFENDRIARQNP